jgi:hypothetical protein
MTVVVPLSRHTQSSGRFLNGVPGWTRPLVLVTPSAVVNWHRAGFCLYWAWVSRVQQIGRRKRVPREDACQPSSRSHFQTSCSGPVFDSQTLALLLIHLHRLPKWPRVPLVAVLLTTLMGTPLLGSDTQRGPDKDATRLQQAIQATPPGDHGLLSKWRREKALQSLQDLGIVMFQRSLQFPLFQPKTIAASGDTVGPNDLAFSLALRNVNFVPAVMLSCALSADRSDLSPEQISFLDQYERRLKDYQQMDPENLQKLTMQSRNKMAHGRVSLDNAVLAELDYQALVAALKSVMPEYAKFYSYQSPVPLAPGEVRTFVLMDPRIPPEEGMSKGGDLFQSVYLVKVIRSKVGNKSSFHIAGNRGLLSIRDWEGYVPRHLDQKALRQWDLNHSPPMEFDPAFIYVSEAETVLDLQIIKGVFEIGGTSTVIPRGQYSRTDLTPVAFPAGPPQVSTGEKEEKDQVSGVPPVSQPAPREAASAPVPAFIHMDTMSPVPSVVMQPTPPAPIRAAAPGERVVVKPLNDEYRAYRPATASNISPSQEDSVGKAAALLALYDRDPESRLDRLSTGGLTLLVSQYVSQDTAPREFGHATGTGILSATYPAADFETPGMVLADIVRTLKDMVPVPRLDHSVGEYLINYRNNALKSNDPIRDPMVLTVLGFTGPEWKGFGIDDPSEYRILPSPGERVTTNFEDVHEANAVYDGFRQGSVFKVLNCINLFLRDGKELLLSCLSWKWRKRSSVKIAERTYEKGKKTLQRRREGGDSEAAPFGQGSRLGPV